MSLPIVDINDADEHCDNANPKIGSFLRDLMHCQDVEFDSEYNSTEPVTTTDELADMEYFEPPDIMREPEDSHQNRRTNSAGCLLVPQPSPNFHSEQRTSSSKSIYTPTEEEICHKSHSLPDFYVFNNGRRAVLSAKRHPEEYQLSLTDNETTSHLPGVRHSRQHTVPIEHEGKKRRYQRRGAVRIRNWNASRHSVEQPSDANSSMSEDESPSDGKALINNRCDSLPTVSVCSTETSDSTTWPPGFQENLEFENNMTGSLIFDPVLSPELSTKFQMLKLPSEPDQDLLHLEKVDAILADVSDTSEDSLPHSAPPFPVERNPSFNFERRKSVVQELPSISEDVQEDEETKDQPRYRIISGNPNVGSSTQLDNSNLLRKTSYDLPNRQNNGIMVMEQNGAKLMQLAETKRFSSAAPQRPTPMRKQKSQTSLSNFFFGRFNSSSRQGSDDSIGSLSGTLNAGLQVSTQRRSLKWKSLFGKTDKPTISATTPARDSSTTSMTSILSCMAALDMNDPAQMRFRHSSSPEGRDFPLQTLLEDSVTTVTTPRGAWNMPRSRHSCAAIDLGALPQHFPRYRRFSVVAPEEYYDKDRYRIAEADSQKLDRALSRMDLSDLSIDVDPNASARSMSINMDLFGAKDSSTIERSPNYMMLRKKRALSNHPAPAVHRLDVASLTPRRTPIQKKKAKAKQRRQSGKVGHSAVDFIEPGLLHSATSGDALLPVLAKIPDTTLRKQLRNERDKKPGMILTTLLSIRHKKKKDSRTPSVISPGSFDLDALRRAPSDFPTPPRKISEALPESLARVFDTSSEGEWKLPYSQDQSSWPMWIMPKWQDLQVWENEQSSWSAKHPTIELEPCEVKRQNIIFELYVTEQRHCRVLIHLQQVFQSGLLNHNVLSTAETKELIPDVLDPLLDFHLGLFRRLKARLSENSVVDTISDIVYDEFKHGKHRNDAMNAYTEFCLARSQSDASYNGYITKNPQFKDFMEQIHKSPMFKNLSFKSCFLLVTQRLTKYPILIEQMAKYETEDRKAQTAKALHAVRNFALRIDRDMSSHLLHQRFDNIRQMMDRNSVGDLLGNKFTYNDLILEEDEHRKILSIGSVTCRSATHQTFELSMLLFDDVVVFLQNKNGVLHFFYQKDHASILPLHATLVREMPRSNEVMLIVASPQKPDMYKLTFNSKSEMTQWVQMLKSAHANAPKFVRTAKGFVTVEVFNQGPKPNR